MAFAAEDFSGTPGTNLQTHNPNWVRYSSSNGNGTLTPAGRVRGSASGILLYYHAASPASADYSVSADIYRASTEASARTCVTARQVTGSMTCYTAGIDGDGGIWLSRLVSGSETQLAKATHTFPQGETRRVRLACLGSAIKVYVDASPTPVISVTDATITAAGKAGLRIGYFGSAAPTDSTCMHLDAWEAADPPGPAAELEGQGVAQAEAGGDLDTRILLSGDAWTQAASSAAMSTDIDLSAVSVADATVGGMLATAIRLGADAQSVAVATALMASPGIEFSAQVTAQAEAAGMLGTAIRLSAATSGQAAASGELDTQIGFMGMAMAEAIATGSLALPLDMAGTAAGHAAATGELSTQIRCDADAWARTAVSSVLATAIRLSAGASAQPSAAGELEGPMPLVIDPKFVSKARARRYTALFVR